MNKKSAKDLAWDRERARFRHRISELEETVRQLNIEIGAADAVIENCNAVIAELNEDIERLTHLQGFQPEDLRKYLEECHEKDERDKQSAAALKALMQMRNTFP